MIAGVLLLAGASRRYGADKRWALLADGTPVALAAARALAPAVDALVAVLREDDAALAELLHCEGALTVGNGAPERGMGHSIALGVGSAAGAEGWLLMPGDLPWVQAPTCRAVADRLRTGEALVAPECAGRRGHPVGFGRQFGPALRGLGGERAGGDLLRRHGAALCLLPVDDEGIWMDVDRPEDLRRPVGGTRP